MISTLTAALNQGHMRVIVGLFRPGWLQAECERLGVRTIVIPIAGVLGLQWFLGYWDLIRKERVALIHAHEFSAIVCGWMLAKMTGVPLVATVHGKNYFWEKWRRRVAYRIVSRYGSLVAVSADLKRFICDKVGVAAEQVQIIYNGVAAAQPVADEEAQACKAEGWWAVSIRSRGIDFSSRRCRRSSGGGQVRSCWWSGEASWRPRSKRK